MAYLSRPPHLLGEQVVFNDRVFVFPDQIVAQEAAARLADCNTRNSLWELVDLVEKLGNAAPEIPRPGRIPGSG